MAKKRRRRRAPTDPLEPSTRRRPRHERGLIEGSSVDAMAPPNNLVPGAITRHNPFPAMGICSEEQDSSVFTDPKYGTYYWEHAMDFAPPSWMDPLLLVALARQDDKVKDLLRRALASNSKKPSKALARELARVFKSQYVATVLNKFDGVKELLAEWMIINAAERKLAALEKAERDRPKRKGRRKAAANVE